MKTTECTSKVPAIFTSNKVAIEVGTIIEYKKLVFRNGEHHLVLADNTQVPAIFFDVE